MEQSLTVWLAQYGAPALFVLLTLGVIGLPIPDETLLVIAGLLVGRGQLPPLSTAAAGVIGAMAGITVSYAIGRFAGSRVLSRFGAAIRLDQSLITRVGQWFEQFGKWLLPIGYFIPGVRHVTAVVAGASGLPGWTFAVFAYSGAIVWVSCFLAIGYALGDRWPTFVTSLHRQVLIVVALAGAILVGYVLWVRSKAISGSK